MKLIAVLALVLLLAMPAAAEVYTVKPGTIKALAWQAPSSGAEIYEYYFLQMEDGRIYGRGEVPNALTTIRFRTSGTYALWVRACNSNQGVRQCGGWSNSTDPGFGTVNGAPAPWLIKVGP